MDSLEISYKLNPPTSAHEQTQLSAAKTHRFDLKPITECKDQREYYSNLSAAIMDGKERVGKELTIWKEAAGSSERSKTSVHKRDSDSDTEPDREAEGED